MTVTVKPITDGLERWPLVGGGQRRRQTDSAQALVVVEQRDMVEVHTPTP